MCIVTHGMQEPCHQPVHATEDLFCCKGHGNGGCISMLHNLPKLAQSWPNMALKSKLCDILAGTLTDEQKEGQKRWKKGCATG